MSGIGGDACRDFEQHKDTSHKGPGDNIHGKPTRDYRDGAGAGRAPPSDRDPSRSGGEHSQG